MDFESIIAAIASAGLACRGAFHPEPGDSPPPGLRTLVLVGFVGGGQWPGFAASPEAQDGQPDGLDRWSRRVVGRVAKELGATALFPFGGPPYLPFQRWAQRAEPVHPSPLGILIHPDWGLWHAYRGVLAFVEDIALPDPDRRASPCDSCVAKPCLSACPVGAFSRAGYDVPACINHIASPSGTDCMDFGCRARRACPVGAEYRYRPDQAQFHLRAFRNAQRRQHPPVGRKSGAYSARAEPNDTERQ